MTAARRSVRLAAVAAVAAATLSACSGDDVHDLGEAVEVDFQPSGTGTVTVTDVVEGSTDELESAGFQLDPDEKAASAYYVAVAFDNDGDVDVVPQGVGAEDPDGALIHALTVLDFGGGPFEPCPGLPEQVAPGEQAEGCTVILVPEGREMERVYYHPGGAEDFVYWKTS